MGKSRRETDKRMLFLLLAPLALVSAAPGSNKCTWGPSYWCANIPQASECSAVKHCIKAVWEKETVPQDDDEVCKICKEMVGEARDTLMSNETQEELREVFDGSCDLIPVGLISKEGKALVEQFVPELVETLASEMNPDTVCTVSGLCNSARIDNLLKEQRSYRHTGGDCLICREGADATKAQLVGETQNQVEDRLLELCGYFGSFTDACRMAVVERADQLYAFITSQSWEEGVCDLAGVCSEAFDDVPATQLQSGEDIQCEFCEKVIKHWVDVYASNASLAEFKQLLDGICEKLDKSNADHCKHVVTTTTSLPSTSSGTKWTPTSSAAWLGFAKNSLGFQRQPSSRWLLSQPPRSSQLNPLNAKSASLLQQSSFPSSGTLMTREWLRMY